MVKSIKIMFIGIFVFLLLYLGIIWVWASFSASVLIREALLTSREVSLLPEQQRVLLKIEDPVFFEHYGLNVSNGQGLTTITSALARDIFLYGHRLNGVSGVMQSFYRAVFDCCKKVDIGRDVMALVLNRHVTKNEQLNFLLSTAYMGRKDGNSIVGFDRAAMAYYDKPLGDLSLQEFSGLVAMVAAPTYYHPLNNPEAHALRTARIINIANGQCEPDGLLDLTYDHC
ncbi:MAG TPA: transglycosylase domain-containing protein [Cellvibrio sp.]